MKHHSDQQEVMAESDPLPPLSLGGKADYSALTSPYD
jgi:hypothetical protein